MKTFKILLIYIFLLSPIHTFAKEYKYILNDECIDKLYNLASAHFYKSKSKVIRDSRGIIIRLKIEDNVFEKDLFSEEIRKNLLEIEYFLAKIENPAIIEVHTGKVRPNEIKKIKNWELSTIIANNIEAIITKPYGTINQDRINSVGYGEFLPAKNPPNNGGKILNRIDIIVLCNVSGE